MKKFLIIINLIFLCVFPVYADEEIHYQEERLKTVMKYIELSGIKEQLTQPYIQLKPTGYFGAYEKRTPISQVIVAKGDNQRKNKVAITFDDSFTDEQTAKILDILDKHNCKATFFITLECMCNRPESVKEIVKRGHELGSHSSTHIDFTTIDTNRTIWEIKAVHTMVKELTGIDMCLFRFPFGKYTPDAIELLRQYDYFPIQWTVSAADTDVKTAEEAIERAESKGFCEGYIYLFHNGPEITPRVLENILGKIDSQGLSYLRVSELIYPDAFEVKDGIQSLSLYSSDLGSPIEEEKSDVSKVIVGNNVVW